MKLHEDKKLFRDAVRATSEFKEIREVYIEKDYWVTYVLKNIFLTQWASILFSKVEQLCPNALTLLSGFRKTLISW